MKQQKRLSPVTAVNKAVLHYEHYFTRSNKNAIENVHIKHLCHILILKHAVLMFIQRRQPSQINKCLGNAGNAYLIIVNAFKNHINIIEKNYISIIYQH